MGVRERKKVSERVKDNQKRVGDRKRKRGIKNISKNIPSRSV